MKLGMYLTPTGNLVELKKSIVFDYHVYSDEYTIIMKFDKGSEFLLEDYLFICSL